MQLCSHVASGICLIQFSFSLSLLYQISPFSHPRPHPHSPRLIHLGNYSRLICEIQFARSMGYYLIQIYIPASLIVIISWVSFWLHRNATPARVSLGVTTVLTMTTLMSSTNSALPKISYIKSIDVYLGTCFVMVFASLLEYATVGYLGKRIAMHRSRTAQLSKMAELHRSRCTAAAAAAAAAATTAATATTTATTVTSSSGQTISRPPPRGTSATYGQVTIGSCPTCSSCAFHQQQQQQQQTVKSHPGLFSDDVDYDGPIMNCLLTTSGASALHNSANLPVLESSNFVQSSSSSNDDNHCRYNSSNNNNNNNSNNNNHSSSNTTGAATIVNMIDVGGINVECWNALHRSNCTHKSPHHQAGRGQGQQEQQCSLLNCANVTSNTVTVS